MEQLLLVGIGDIGIQYGLVSQPSPNDWFQVVQKEKELTISATEIKTTPVTIPRFRIPSGSR
jgi:hypothetical protein